MTKTKLIEVSECCKANLVEDFKLVAGRDHHDPEPIYTCEKCKQECEVADVCGECNGTGKVPLYMLDGYEWVQDDEKDCICIINQKENA